jgi:heme/copper-type cytochrome/quinol oxidase subunit 3
VAAAANAYILPINPAERRNPGWWAMVLIVVTEAMLFAYLLFAYFYLGSMANTPWPPGGPPALKLVVPNTIILLASSGTMWWGESGIRAGSQMRLRLGLLVTLLLGAAFLVIQGIEYSKKDFGLQSNAYGSLFFTITGFHGAHVFVGLLFNIFVQIRAWLGHFSAKRHLAVTNAAMYWHFVDAVWLVVFTSLYLAPWFA